ncbi:MULTISPECIES: hypothetical protein [Oscillatoriales]|nr:MULTISPECIES: hypothetical protein [Oscillatoriales]
MKYFVGTQAKTKEFDQIICMANYKIEADLVSGGQGTQKTAIFLARVDRP